MVPAVKRSTLSQEMESNTDTTPQNSITVAGGGAATRTRSESNNSSTQSSPTAMENPPDDVPRPGVASTANNSSHGNGHVMAAATRPTAYDYEFADLDEITVRQLNEDILAYEYDHDYCKAQLEEADLTPQETRTLQLRILDLQHQIRYCKHRIETIRVQTRKPYLHPSYGAMAGLTINRNSGTNGGGGSSSGKQYRSAGGGLGDVLLGRRTAATPAAATPGSLKRPAQDEDGGEPKRFKAGSPDFDMMGGGSDDGGVNTALQRLGFWKCRLCSAPKYLLAGSGRSPAAPCKWPLKDISKMITHFTEMHGEHTPAERCVELGAALSQNRGPFEYWLRRTRAQNVGDGSVIDDCLAALLNGKMPALLRRHSRAAAGMPAT
ncbi:hypothetical protein VTK56DRAFT_9010 [Thermocarpiscus australiensis]